MSTDWAAHDVSVRAHYGANLSATSRIRHVLTAAITAGEIAPGVRLKEMDLGRQLWQPAVHPFAKRSPP